MLTVAVALQPAAYGDRFGMYSSRQINRRSRHLTIIPFKGIRTGPTAGGSSSATGLVALGIGRSRDDHCGRRGRRNAYRGRSGTTRRVPYRHRITASGKVCYRSRRGAIARQLKSVRWRTTRCRRGEDNKPPVVQAAPLLEGVHGSGSANLRDGYAAHSGASSRIRYGHFVHARREVGGRGGRLTIVPQVNVGAGTARGGGRSTAPCGAGGAGIGHYGYGRALRLSDGHRSGGSATHSISSPVTVCGPAPKLVAVAVVSPLSHK